MNLKLSWGFRKHSCVSIATQRRLQKRIINDTLRLLGFWISSIVQYSKQNTVSRKMDLVPSPGWGGTYSVGPIKVRPKSLYLRLACVLPLVCFPTCGLFEVSEPKYLDQGKLGSRRIHHRGPTSRTGLSRCIAVGYFKTLNLHCVQSQQKSPPVPRV